MAEKRTYVQAADFVRALTIVSVVVVHSTWYMAAGGTWVSSGAVLALMHFTRESFMALTGFVLTLSLFGKNVKWGSVWAKRYKLVLFPYLIWSAAYILLFKGPTGIGAFFATYGHDLLTGAAWFHLYYLLITMQFYLILPLFLLLMRVAKKHPVWVVALTFVFQMALMAYDQYWRGSQSLINQYTGDEVWSYALFFVVGGVAALHWPKVREWLKGHMATVLWLSALTAAIMLTAFFLQTYLLHDMIWADNVLQPAMMPWSVMTIVLLSAIGVRYEAVKERMPMRWPVIKWLADLSFGIYLAHPMLLQYWTNLVAELNMYHPSFWLDGVTAAVLVAGTGIAMALIGKTPISPWIIGRAAIRPMRAPAMQAAPQENSVSQRLQES